MHLASQGCLNLTTSHSNQVVTLLLVKGGDGITPVKKPILGLMCKLVDPSRNFITCGGTRPIPLILAYAKEKDCQFLASLLNMLIGEICATKFVFDTKLVIQIAPFCNFGDGKFMWLASGLSGGSSDHSCWMCDFPKSDWVIGADVSSSRKTVADQGRSYLRALFSTLNAMLSTQLNGVTSARKLLTSACAQVGCGQHNFPYDFDCNEQAKQILLNCLEELLYPNKVLPDDHAAVVESVLSDLLRIDAILRKSPQLSFPPGFDGYDISDGLNCVCLDHSIKGAIRSILIDYVLRGFQKGTQRLSVEKALLNLADLTSWYDHCYTYSIRSILAKVVYGGLFDRYKFPLPQQQVLFLLHMLCGIAYQSKEYSYLDRVVLKLTSALLWPFIRLLLVECTLFPCGAQEGERAKLISPEGKLQMNLHAHCIEHFSGTFESSGRKINLIFLCEGGLDWYLGRLQAIIRARGGGGPNELARCEDLLNTITQAETTFKLKGGKREEKNKKTLPAVLVRPVLVAPELVIDENFGAALNTLMTCVAAMEELKNFSQRLDLPSGTAALFAPPCEATDDLIDKLKRGIGSDVAPSSVWCLCKCPGTAHSKPCVLA